MTTIERRAFMKGAGIGALAFTVGGTMDRQIGGFSHLTRKLRGVQFDRFSNNRRPFGPTQTDPAARRTSLRRNMRRHSGAALGSEMP